MDSGNGYFERVDKEKVERLLKENPLRPVDGIFSVGEELQIKGSRFRVQSIRPKKMILKLLKKEK